MIAVAVAVMPEAFDCGEHSPDGGPWELFGEEYDRNPRLLLDPGSIAMVRIWSLHRSGGVGGTGHLPDLGGTLDQSSLMLEALQVMNGAEAKLRQK